eukprot:scaffold1220_cov259-Pinguiococcus_pyrenoidosus.AAC.138
MPTIASGWTATLLGMIHPKSANLALVHSLHSPKHEVRNGDAREKARKARAREQPKDQKSTNAEQKDTPSVTRLERRTETIRGCLFKRRGFGFAPFWGLKSAGREAVNGPQLSYSMSSQDAVERRLLSGLQQAFERQSRSDEVKKRDRATCFFDAWACEAPKRR